MTPEQTLSHHISDLPISPGHLPPNDPAYIKFHSDLSAWVMTKERLEAAANVHGFSLNPLDKNAPICTPRATYEWRDLMGFRM